MDYRRAKKCKAVIDDYRSQAKDKKAPALLWSLNGSLQFFVIPRLHLQYPGDVHH